MTQGVKLGPPGQLSAGVKPTGDSMPARPETVAQLRKRPQGTGEAILGLVGELLQARV